MAAMRRARRRLVAWLALGSSACLSFPPVTETTDGGPSPAGDATAGPGPDSGPAPSADGGEDGAPLPPPTAPCDPAAQPAAAAIFVSTTGDDLLGGTRAAPVKSVGKALALAKTQGATDVYVDEGIYGEEVTLASATAIHGGWKATGATWTKDCAPGVSSLTVLRSTTARVVTVSGFAGTAGLDTLTLSTKGQADPTQSTVAIFVSGASLTMTGVDLTAGIGGDGTTPAAPGVVANRTCNGFSCSSGGDGPTGTPGTAAGVGNFSLTGWVPATGTAGQTGTQGEHGAAGGAGSSATDCVQGCGATPTCAAGGLGTSSGGTGTCGCGGLGGAPGAPGTSGGASVGVMLVGPGTLTASFSNIATGRGGNGAAGGQGGQGGPGTNGAGGTAGFCAGSCYYDATAMACYYSGTGLGGGAAGGKGGKGGQGGQGGGGSGGPAYGVVAMQGAQLAIAPTVAFKVGAGGAGAGGAPMGSAAPTLTVP